MSLHYALIRCAPRRSVCHIITESGPRVGSMHNSSGLHTLRGQAGRLSLRSVGCLRLFRSCPSPYREVLRPVRSCRHRLRHRRLHAALRSHLCLLPCRAPLTHSPSHYRPLRGREVAKREPSRHEVGIGSHIGRNTAYQNFWRLNFAPHSGGAPLHPCIFRTAQRGRRLSLRRAGGGSSDGKRGKIPLSTPLTT